MTNDQRRRYDNLILLCPNHHVITNDENIYTVAVLKKMKSDHIEERRNHNRTSSSGMMGIDIYQVYPMWCRRQLYNTPLHD
jgi:ribosomal protein L15E